MKLRIRHNHFIPKLLKVNGITLYPFILLSESKEKIRQDTYVHEYQHVLQIREDGWFCFYLAYSLYYFAACLRKSVSDPYANIPYEKEAYRLQNGSMPDEMKDLL